MRLLYRILLIALIICIPITSLFAAFNVVLRLPDFYIYEFNKREVTNEINLKIKDEELGTFFSDFMREKHEVFELNVDDIIVEQQSVFNDNEQRVMSNLREVLNLSLIIMAGLLIIIIVIYWLLLMKKLKWELRFAYKGGLIVFVFLAVLMAAAFNIPYTNELMSSYLMMDTLSVEDVLPQLLTHDLARDGLIVSLVISAILLALGGSITWRLTKPRRMFS
ncbi:MAG: DUF1461 domain-containing protein [Anaerovoracaceae bacterium]|jgi:membrane-associated HD superfamily phosphohydrolase